MSKPKVLFIDDEERIVRSLAMQFRASHSVHTTTDPDEALDLVRREHIHVVVSDQRMPRMTGVELLHQVRAISPNSLGVLLTGYADLPAVIGAINDGEIFRYITKPWDPIEFRDVLSKATEIALQLEHTDAPPATEPAQALISDYRILVIDDNPEIHETIAQQFHERYPVHLARTLERAYDLLSNQDIALVISDLRLEGEDITPVLGTLKRYNPNLLTIVLTSMQDSGLLINLINQAQVFRYLPKPVRPNLLDKSVEAALRHYQRLRQTPELGIRHRVDKPAHEGAVSTRILGFLKRVKDRFAIA